MDEREPEPVTLDALDAEIWPLVIAHLDLTAYVSLPQTNAALRAAFDTPRLRIACVKALLGGAARSPLAWAATAQLGVAEQIAAKSRILVLRRHVRSLARAAVTRRSDEVFALCVEELDDVNHVYEDGSSLLELCVAADLPAATALLLRHPDTVLPTVATSIKLQMDDSGAVVGDALTPWQRHTIIALARAGRPLAFLNPILIGVLHHSLAATRAAIETLNSLDVVAFRVPGGGLSGRRTGADYVQSALQANYECATEAAAPFFDCGTGAMHFWSRFEPGAMMSAVPLSRRHWSMVELELRRGDTSRAFVELLLTARLDSSSNALSGKMDWHAMALVVRAKQLALSMMRADADGFDAALDEAMATAVEAIKLDREKELAEKAFVFPHIALLKAEMVVVSATSQAAAYARAAAAEEKVNAATPAVGAKHEWLTRGQEHRERAMTAEARRVAAVEHERRARAVVLRRAGWFAANLSHADAFEDTVQYIHPILLERVPELRPLPSFKGDALGGLFGSRTENYT